MIAEMSDMSVSMTFKTRKLVLQLQLRVSYGMMTVESTAGKGRLFEEYI